MQNCVRTCLGKEPNFSADWSEISRSFYINEREFPDLGFLGGGQVYFGIMNDAIYLVLAKQYMKSGIGSDMLGSKRREKEQEKSSKRFQMMFLFFLVNSKEVANFEQGMRPYQ